MKYNFLLVLTVFGRVFFTDPDPDFFLSDPDPDSGKKVRSVQKDPDPKHCLSTQYAVPPYTHIHSKLCIYVRVIYTCAIHYNMHITLID